MSGRENGIAARRDERVAHPRGRVARRRTGSVSAFIIAIVMNVGSYWFSDKIVLRMYRAQEVGPEHPLHRMTARLAQKAGLPMPRVYIIPDASPNAFATGRNPQHAAVAATEGLLRALSESEVEGVIAHELAHVQNRDILISSVAATMAAAIMMLTGASRLSSAGAATAARAAVRLPCWRWRSCAGRGHADSGGDLASARVCGRSPRRRHRRLAAWSRAGAPAD